MPPDRYAAFVSYAHRHAGWVKALQADLERGLAAAGRPGDKVFLDQVDLGSGRSWVGQLQAGLAQAGHFVLVSTPEALASPRVADEWQSFVASRKDWQAGRFRFRDFAPRRLRLDGAGPPQHIRLDQALETLLGDRLR